MTNSQLPGRLGAAVVLVACAVGDRLERHRAIIALANAMDDSY